MALGCGFLNVTMTYRLTVSKTYPHAGAIVGVWVLCISALTQIGFNQSSYCKAVKHQQNVSVSQFAGLSYLMINHCGAVNWLCVSAILILFDHGQDLCNSKV